MRYRLAILTTRAVNSMSRHLGRGQGTVAGGRSGLKVDPRLLQRLTVDLDVSLVTGTNGKTTTTRLLTVALGVDGARVVSNETGSNMPPGHVAALAGNRSATRAVLEVDEIYLPRVLAATKPTCVVLLNLSRDQLDRTNEVRMVAGNWRAALAAAPHVTVVANADDPLVAWAAGAASKVRWVAVGLGWQLDAVGCPSCEGRIAFAPDGSWTCVSGCGFARPVPIVTLTATDHGTTHHAVWVDGRSQEITLTLPGRFNYANALMAAVAAEGQGIDAASALSAMGTVGEVAGRFTTRVVAGVPVRLMLAKNPAGWSELLDLVGEDDGPIVISINARTADGADPSWLWDVPFERLAARVVVATGDRCRDLSVRLRYAGVRHVMEPNSVVALQIAAAGGDGAVDDDATYDAANYDVANYDVANVVDVIGNYTAFGELLGARP